MHENLVEGDNSSAFNGFDADEIDDNLNSVEAHGESLQGRNKLRVNKLIEDQSESVDEEKNENLNNA